MLLAKSVPGVIPAAAILGLDPTSSGALIAGIFLMLNTVINARLVRSAKDTRRMAEQNRRELRRKNEDNERLERQVDDLLRLLDRRGGRGRRRVDHEDDC